MAAHWRRRFAGRIRATVRADRTAPGGCKRLVVEWGRQECRPSGQHGGRSFLTAPLVSAYSCGFLIFPKSSLESF